MKKEILKQRILLLLLLLPLGAAAASIKVEVLRPVIPVLTLKEINPTIRIDIHSPKSEPLTIHQLALSLEGTTQQEDIISIGVYGAGKDGLIDTSRVICPMTDRTLTLPMAYQVENPGDAVSLWVAVKLKDKVNLSHRIQVNCRSIRTNAGTYQFKESSSGSPQRVGVALRQADQDGVAVSRIPGLTTSKEGTLMAVFDARWDSARDLQGNMDIALQRSFNKGKTWQPMQVILDMKQWGGLPEKFNGVSDASILVDEKSGTIFVAGLWMHGVLDKESGKWIEGLDEESDAWTHQWQGKGSQSGFGVKQTSQFLVTQSSDNGESWSEPVNITSAKKEEWWLYAPAPGRGITLRNGTLVFPSQGRDKQGVPFSNITWSSDGGKTWKASNPAFYDVTECAVVELADGSLMLNMRDNRNRNNKLENGRRICITKDMGETWSEHPTSRKALIEPTCMGSLHRHHYTCKDQPKSILLFSNPSSRVRRDKITLRASYDDGMTWKKNDAILLDQYRGWGYSCITSVDEETIGILYESSQAQMVYQEIKLAEILARKL